MTTALEDLTALQAKWRDAGSNPDIQIQARNQYAEMADELQPIIEKMSAESDMYHDLYERARDFMAGDEALASREGVTDSQQSPPK